MSKKIETSSERAYKERLKEAQTNRMMFIFFLLLIADFALLYFKGAVDRAPIDSYLSLEFFPNIKYFLPIPAIILIATAIYKLIKKTDDKLKFFTPSLFLGLAAVLFAVFVILSVFWNSGFLFAIIFVTVSALLYFVSIIFPRSFFIFSFFNSFAAFSIYFVKWLEEPHTFVVGGLFIAFAITFFIFTLALKQNNGKIGKYTVLPSDCDYLPLMVACLVYFILLFAVIFLTQFTLYYIIAIALETLIFGIFYSIKMLK